MEISNSMEVEKFVKEMPKIELHAHLNGSLSRTSIMELAKFLYGENLTPKFLKQYRLLEDQQSTLSKCFEKFALMHELTSSTKGLQMATKLIMRDFHLDNVVYLELRTTPKSTKDISRRQYLQIVLQAIEDYSRINSKMIVKLLVSINRGQSKEIADEIVDLVIELKHQYPQLIKGIDFSGDPSKARFEIFIPSLSKAKEHNIPLALHCGELPNTEKEIQIMLDFGFQRCGHGTHLSHKQYQQCKSQNITIECCLTSNIQCGTVANYEAHHFNRLYHEGVKVVLCTDDCGVFNTTVTQEFLKALYNYKIDIKDIYVLSMNAIDAAFAENDEKHKLKQTVCEFYLANIKLEGLENDEFFNQISKKYKDLMCKQ